MVGCVAAIGVGCVEGRLVVEETPQDSDSSLVELDDDRLETVSTLPDPPAELDWTPAADVAGAPEVSRNRGAAARPFGRARFRRMRSDAGTSAAAGSGSDSFSGSPDRLFGRIWLSPSPWIQGGAVVEKDPGELPEHGFASAFVKLARGTDGPEIIAGDYRVHAGSGVLLGRASFSRAGSRAFTGFAGASGPFRPHTSSDESRFFRGLAARLPFLIGPWSVDAAGFVSSIQRSGRIDGAGIFSPDDTGLFRSRSEIERLRTNRELLGGAVVALRRGEFRAAFTGLRTELEHPTRILTGGGSCSWCGGSIEAAYAGSRYELSGEAAFSRTRALTLEARASPSRHLTTVLQVQSVQPGFLSPYGLDRSGRPASGNTNSIVLAGVVRPARWARGTLAATMFSRSEPQPPDPGSSVRARYSADVELFLTPDWSVQLFAGTDRADGGITGSDPEGRSLRAMREDERFTLRIRSAIDAGGIFSILNRCDFVSAVRASQEGEERGMLMQIDLKLRLTPAAKAGFRASVFTVSGWGARVYSAEEDVEGAMRIPVFTGRGVRLYALVRWAVLPAAALSIKYGVTFQESVSRTPSLESDVHADERDLSMQLDVAW